MKPKMKPHQEFLSRLDKRTLREALWYLRREISRPYEPNPAAAQWAPCCTASQVRAEYRRRGWKVPKPTRAERP